MLFFNSLTATVMVLASATAVASAFNNMLVIILENTDYTAAIADPNLQAFASSGVLFSNWDAIGHPSQPNYIALTSGSTNGITNDNSKTINVQNVADLLEAKGLTWKSYQENWPGDCFKGSVSKDGLYFRLV
jgi:Phosphoesterase family